jgi:uncharacterized protein YcfJ
LSHPKEQLLLEASMEPNNHSKRIHPLIATAAVSVILVSLVGAAAITGILPTSHGTNAPVTTLVAPTSTPDTSANTPRTVSSLASANVAGQPVTASQPVYGQQPQIAYNEPKAVAKAPVICSACGRIESIHEIHEAGKGSGLGIAAGAILGGVLGNQFGHGNGRALTTVAGAAGGGYAGNEVEKHVRSSTSYEVRVRMENGKIHIFHYAQPPGWHVGDHVRIVHGSLVARG